VQVLAGHLAVCVGEDRFAQGMRKVNVEDSDDR
jgi:hypothetical protein